MKDTKLYIFSEPVVLKWSEYLVNSVTAVRDDTPVIVQPLPSRYRPHPAGVTAFPPVSSALSGPHPMLPATAEHFMHNVTVIAW